MTEAQKAIIENSRKVGIGYRKIASSLGVSISTIASYCSRNGLADMDEPTSSGLISICKNCGKTICSIPGKKRRIFCCRECGYTWWKNHPDQKKARNPRTFVCACCGKPFTESRNRIRWFCSIACSSAFRRKEANREAQ